MTTIEVISHSYPSTYSSYDATFVKDHILAISESFNVRLTVPTPYTIPFTSRHKKNHSSLLLPENIYGSRIKYLSLPNKRLPGLIQSSLSKKLITHFRTDLPDLFHFHFLYPSGLAISQIKDQTKRPVVLTIHGVDYYHTKRDPLLRNLTRQQMRSADVVIAVGPKLFQDISEDNPELDGKLTMIYNHVDTSVFYPPGKEEKKRINNQLELSSESFQLLCIANIRFKKGIDVLIKALNDLKVNKEIELHLIGRLHDEPDYLEELNLLTDEYGLSNVHFHGPKSRSEIINWLKAVDGFVLPSRDEPFGISLIEAMACGLPVISTKSGGPEVILSKNHGRLVEPGDVNMLSIALSEMVSGSDKKDAEQLNNYVNQNFGKAKYAERYANLYNNLIKKTHI